MLIFGSPHTLKKYMSSPHQLTLYNTTLSSSVTLSIIVSITAHHYKNVNYLLTYFILNTLKHIIFDNMRKADRTNQCSDTSYNIEHIIIVNESF